MNKEEPFTFLTSKTEEFSWPPHKALYDASQRAVLSFGSSSTMDSCNHEEEDTRMVVHVQHALEQGARSVLVCTVDTDVVVILADTKQRHLWMDCGQDSMAYTYSPANATLSHLIL